MAPRQRYTLVCLSLVSVACAARKAPPGPPPTQVASTPTSDAKPAEPAVGAATGSALEQHRGGIELCELGHGEICLGLGMNFQKPEIDDLVTSTKLLARACDLGVAAGCFELGQSIMAGRGVPADREQGIAKMLAACEMGLPTACLLAGMNSNDPELATGKRQLDKAMTSCDQGVADGCVAAAEMLDSGGLLPRDAARAFGLLERACKAKHVRACQGVASSYEVGAGVAADPARAVKMYTAQCKGGDLDSCCHLGSLHAEGKIVPQAPDRAMSVWDDACNKGSGSCCVQAGALLAEGKAVAAAPARALAYFQKGCDHDEPAGCGILGATYEYGSEAVAADLDKAEAAYLKACKLGAFKGCEEAYILQQRRRHP